MFLPLALQNHCLDRVVGVDLVMVLDVSSSMAEPVAAGGASKLEEAVAAAHGLARSLSASQDRVGIVAFSTTAERITPLTFDRDRLVGDMLGLATSHGTRIDLGLYAGLDTLADSRPGARRGMLLLTDGHPSGTERAAVRAAAATVVDSGVDLYIVGIGADVDQDLLASLPSTGVYLAARPGDLQRLAQQIAAKLPCRRP